MFILKGGIVIGGTHGETMWDRYAGTEAGGAQVGR